MTSQCYRIGPIGWDLSSDDGDSISYTGAPYDVFTGGRAVDGGALLPLTIHKGMPSPPDSMPLFRAGKNWAAWDEGATLFFGVGLDSGPLRRACRVDRGLCAGDLWIGDDSMESPLRYPLDQVLAWGMLSRGNGVLMHAAAVVKNGVAYVLTGSSGAGKTTLSGVCREAGWDVLNDDRVILYAADAEWKVAGTPWHGSGCFWQNRQVMLGGVFVLQQDCVDVAELLNKREARLSLLETVSVPWFESTWSQGTLDALAALTESVPVSRFRFTKTVGAVAVLEQSLRAGLAKVGVAA